MHSRMRLAIAGSVWRRRRRLRRNADCGFPQNRGWLTTAAAVSFPRI